MDNVQKDCYFNIRSVIFFQGQTSLLSLLFICDSYSTHGMPGHSYLLKTGSGPHSHSQMGAFTRGYSFISTLFQSLTQSLVCHVLLICSLVYSSTNSFSHFHTHYCKQTATVSTSLRVSSVWQEGTQGLSRSGLRYSRTTSVVIKTF
jgi:hypothetical protein